MNRGEEIKNESSILSSCLVIIGDVDRKLKVTRDNCNIIEYDLPYNAKRMIKIDSQKNYVIVYTYDPNVKPNMEEKEKEMLFGAYINEGLVMTGLELNFEKGEYRYKSSQGFPKGVDVSGVVQYFITMHDAHFPKLRDCIENFHEPGKNPSDCAKEFIKSTKNN